MLNTGPASEALIGALADVERHVSSVGWDQPARLFALVETARLIKAEPGLSNQLGHLPDDSLSAVEQDDFHAGDDLISVLGRITWSDAVDGCAIAVERAFLPPECENQVPDEPNAAAEFVANHPLKQDVRVVVGALRSGQTYGLARFVNAPEDLMGAEDLVPGLSTALLATLDGETQKKEM